MTEGRHMKNANGCRILRIPLARSNAYAAVEGDRAILIDTGKTGEEQKIARILKSMGFSPGNIRLIVLTHAHYDHCGALKALKDMTDARTLVHHDEAGFLKRGHSEFPKGTMWFSKGISRIGRTFAKRMGRYQPVSPDITIGERFELQAYGVHGYILPTPGHTSGSISVIIDNTHAIVGDTLFNIFRKSVYPPFADDEAELLKSWGKLYQTDCAYFYPGHGKPFGKDKFGRTYRAKKKNE